MKKTAKKTGSVVMKVKKQTEILRILGYLLHLNSYCANLPVL